jgi:hypothetical protein
MESFESEVANYYKLEKKFLTTPFYTATQYARNAIFSGLTPLEMEKQFPQYWKKILKKG